jgi:hypothetical protein
MSKHDETKVSISRILEQRRYTKELYSEHITPSTILTCGIPASKLAFHILRHKMFKETHKKKQKYVRKQKVGKQCMV